jgi:hypothetical protein
MKHARQVLDKYPSRVAAAEAIGVDKPNTVRKWVQHNRIPPQYWRRIVASVDGVTLVNLCEIAEANPIEGRGPQDGGSTVAKVKKTKPKKKPKRKVTNKTPSRAKRKPSKRPASEGEAPPAAV